jgi:hypothetical protein
MCCRAVAAVLPELVPGRKRACDATGTTPGTQGSWRSGALYACPDVEAHCGLQCPDGHLGKDNAGRFTMKNDKITRQKLNI